MRRLLLFMFWFGVWAALLFAPDIEMEQTRDGYTFSFKFKGWFGLLFPGKRA